MQGWICLHRRFLTSPFWQDPYYCKLWTYCLLKASHAEHEQLIGNQMIKLQPGQFVTGRFALYEDYNNGMKPENRVSEKTVYRWLENLEKCGMLTIKKTNKFSVVTIVNWLEYQQSDQQMTNSCPTDDQQMSTNNNGNNGQQKNTPRLKPSKPVYDKESPPYVLAQFYLNKILEFKPDFKKPDLQTWADDMRKLIELDKRDPKEIGKVIQWVTKDLFWQPIAQCPAKLRQKWDAITTRMKNEGIRPSNKNVVQFTAPPITDKEREDLADITRKQAERNGVPFALS